MVNGVCMRGGGGGGGGRGGGSAPKPEQIKVISFQSFCQTGRQRKLPSSGILNQRILTEATD